MKTMNVLSTLLVAIGLIAAQCNGVINASQAQPLTPHGETKKAAEEASGSWGIKRKALAAITVLGMAYAAKRYMSGESVPGGDIVPGEALPGMLSVGGAMALSFGQSAVKSMVQSQVISALMSGAGMAYRAIAGEEAKQAEQGASVAPTRSGGGVAPVKSTGPQSLTVEQPKNIPAPVSLTSANVDEQLRSTILKEYPGLAKNPKLSAKVINDKVKLIKEIVTITKQDPWKLIKEKKMNKDLEVMLKNLRSRKS